MAKINGKASPESDGMTLTDFLAQNDYKETRIVVELNGSIIKKEAYASTVISPEDTIEIVTFVGGGCI